MTTYDYTITIDDGEYMALSAALNLMMEHCDRQMLSGPTAPFWAYRRHCEQLIQKLDAAQTRMTSTNTFAQK